MTTAAEQARDVLEVLSEDKKLHFFRMWMKDFERPAAEKADGIRRYRQWLDALTGEEVAKSYQRHYSPTYLNLLSAFMDELAPAEIHKLAVRCIKSKVWAESEFHYQLSWLLEEVKSGAPRADGVRPFRLEGLDVGLVRGLLAKGRGLIICTFRLGPVRFLSTEMALAGLAVNEAVNRHTFEIMESALATLGDAAPAAGVGGRPEAVAGGDIRLLKSVNAEAPLCTAHIVDALKRGEVVGFCVEGNTGADGPWGDTSKEVVRFFNHDISAKSGAARLAAALGTPILPVVALREGEGSGRLVFHEPILPERGMKPAHRGRFVAETMQSLYGMLESYARRYPEQWEGWSALHRWRVPEPEGRPEPQSGARVDFGDASGLLLGGRSFHVNRRRVALLQSNNGAVWVDLKTLKGYRNPPGAEGVDLLRALCEPCGVDGRWLEGCGASRERVEAIVELLGRLGSAGLIFAS
jgi:predicted LPLAT superfamily acyltransferase